MKSKKQYIICPDDNELSQFIEGTLPEERENFILQHLDKCEECAKAVRLVTEFNAFGDDENIDENLNITVGKAGFGLLAGGTVVGKLVDDILSHAHEIPKVAEKNFDTDERNFEVDDSLTVDNQKETDMSTINEANKLFGEEAKLDTSGEVYQWYSDTCAIRSQQLVLNDFGIPVTQEELINEASLNGWYNEGEGTSMDAVGNLLDSHGIPNERMQNATIFNLTSELAQGHKVIVGVDSGELYGKLFEGLEDKLGDRPDHALIVAGIDTTDPKNVTVIIKDPGTGDVAKPYPLEDFVNAWEDSGCFMVSTSIPAPVEYNPEMSGFDYGLGHIESIGNMPYEYFEQTVMPLNANLALGSDMQNNLFSEFKEMVLGDKFSLSAVFDDAINSLWHKEEVNEPVDSFEDITTIENNNEYDSNDEMNQTTTLFHDDIETEDEGISNIEQDDDTEMI